MNPPLPVLSDRFDRASLHRIARELLCPGRGGLGKHIRVAGVSDVLPFKNVGRALSAQIAINAIVHYEKGARNILSDFVRCR